jgi:hypothetical protein
MGLFFFFFFLLACLTDHMSIVWLCQVAQSHPSDATQATIKANSITVAARSHADLFPQQIGIHRMWVVKYGLKPMCKAYKSGSL